LSKSGIQGKLLKWFENYLANRKQRVVLNGEGSTLREILAGVPQGSILGPLLFLIYINDITEAVTSNMKLYADDAIIYLDFNDPDTAAEHL
jgi:hypothetical protein